ncbi:SRPBCC family protein [Virgibacillus halodenitrificans]|uniref:CoxG family protein n=1 Tax=Virgibacillus halodenitrificans TaxID=1482 RepID=UPI0013688584|nr:SRPBCC family protein [Virgibacillus halodenitrificans]MYL45869.1 SRPBCC family protein [Virgibacillus halodenitrificans]
MPSGIHQLCMKVPIETTWKFISDMDNWAPLVPGYLSHKILNEKQSIWKLKGESGLIQKTVTLRIDIEEWREPNSVTFNLTGISENVVGKGYFKAKEVDTITTEMTGHLSIAAKGVMAPMINSILKSIVPKTTKGLTESVAKRMTARQPMPAFK